MPFVCLGSPAGGTCCARASAPADRVRGWPAVGGSTPTREHSRALGEPPRACACAQGSHTRTRGWRVQLVRGRSHPPQPRASGLRGGSEGSIEFYQRSLREASHTQPPHPRAHTVRCALPAPPPAVPGCAAHSRLGWRVGMPPSPREPRARTFASTLPSAIHARRGRCQPARGWARPSKGVPWPVSASACSAGAGLRERVHTHPEHARLRLRVRVRLGIGTRARRLLAQPRARAASTAAASICLLPSALGRRVC